MTESNSSIAAEHDIRCKRGDSFKRVLKYWQDQAKAIPVDITLDSFRMVVVSQDRQTVLSFTIGSGLAISSTNMLTMIKSASEMLVPSGVYAYDIQKTFTATGVVTTIQRGKFIIEDDIS